MALRIGSRDEPAHILRGIQPFSKVYRGAELVWQNTDPPTITGFSVSPNTVDLDTIGTGKLTFTIAVTGFSGKSTVARIVRDPQATYVGPEYSAAAGSNISETLGNIDPPTENQIYRLLAQNDGGIAHRDIEVSVTQNPALSNLAARYVAGGASAPQGGTVHISGQIKGYPQPTLSIDQSWGAVSNRHWTRVAGETNTWAFDESRFYGTIARHRTWILTATNSSGSITGRVVLP